MNTLIAACAYHSSPISWCEPKYQYSQWLVEYWNTLTSLSLLGFAVLGYFTNVRRHGLSCWPVGIYHLLLGLIGVSSAWFHGTLSLAGQLADEIFIIWFLWTLLATESNCSTLVVLLGYLTSGLLLILAPQVNAIALIVLGMVLAWHRIFWTEFDPKLEPLLRQMSWSFLLSLVCWFADQLCFSEAWHSHAIWHLLVGWAGHQLILFWSWPYLLRESNQAALMELKSWNGFYWCWGTIEVNTLEARLNRLEGMVAEMTHHNRQLRNRRRGACDPAIRSRRTLKDHIRVEPVRSMSDSERNKELLDIILSNNEDLDSSGSEEDTFAFLTTWLPLIFPN